jgi:hypothetical protein
MDSLRRLCAPFLAPGFLALSLCLTTGATLNAASGDDPAASFDSRRRKLIGVSLPRLAALAGECKKSRLYAEADSLWKCVLVIDPDHRAARKALRYYRIRGDEWYQSKSYRVPKNRAVQGLSAVRASVEQELRAVREGMLSLLEEYGERLGREHADAELVWLLRLLPEDGAVRAAVGEERHGDEWLLTESITALKHREAFPLLARACLRLAPEPLEARIRAEERALGLPWNAAKKTEALRVIATTGAPEARHAARVAHAVGDYFRNVLAGGSAPRADFTLYMLQGVERDHMIDAWPGLDPATRKGLRAAAGGWLGKGNRLAEWSTIPARRVDGAARQTLGTLLMDSYGITGRQGWAWEGIGLYMVHELVGTRLTWFFDTHGYQPQTATGLWSRLQAPEADWFSVASELFEAEGTPSLVFLLGREINDMREQDVLVSYILAAYLLEGHPQQTPLLLTRLGQGRHPVRVFEETLGYSIHTIEARLHRWLLETR